MWDDDIVTDAHWLRVKYPRDYHEASAEYLKMLRREALMLPNTVGPEWGLYY